MRKKLLEAQEEVKSAREMADKAKCELLSLEFKRGNMSQELGRLNNDVSRRKTQVTALETEIQVKAEETKNMWSLGVTREDCLEIKAIKEENVSLKSKLRNVEGLQLERDELVRQMEAAKEDLFREQKHGRARMEELQEEMDNLAGKLEETESNWSLDQAQLAKLEAAVKKIEKEKNELLQEKAKQCEELKVSLKEENLKSQNRLKKELTDLDTEVQELKAKVNNLQLENIMKDGLTDKLRSEINEMGAIIDRERQEKQRMSSEQKKVLENLKKETGSAVLRLRESMSLENQRALEELKKQLEEEKREAAARSDQRLMHILDKHTYQIEAKNAEIARLEDVITRLESSRQMELHEQIIDAVQREREKIEREKDLQFREEKEEEKRRNNDLLATIDREKQSNRDLMREITGLKKVTYLCVNIQELYFLCLTWVLSNFLGNKGIRCDSDNITL
ncbi:unnamed protein product [Candidula unifasciata]|uniref:Uncharacterized protein n=1 Tax=Candidula unifasciata TaxID=100452 RepID=A0A8S3YM36_9EUPU|nr:unnamed protein product [Candidula unifasciata]